MGGDAVARTNALLTVAVASECVAETRLAAKEVAMGRIRGPVAPAASEKGRHGLASPFARHARVRDASGEGGWQRLAYASTGVEAFTQSRWTSRR
jgi:hypothetical protein